MTNHVAPARRTTFINDLSFADLQRLRRIVKRVHMQSFPPHTYNDREADRLIEAFGPELAERSVRLAITAKYESAKVSI